MHSKRAQEEKPHKARDWKVIDGKRVKVKYKAFRLPVTFIKKLNVYAAQTEHTLEKIVYDALKEYVANHPPKE